MIAEVLADVVAWAVWGQDVPGLSPFIQCMCGLFWQFYVVRQLEGFIR